LKISENAPKEWKFKAAGGHHRAKAIEAWMNKMKTEYEMMLAEETHVADLPADQIDYIDKVVKLHGTNSRVFLHMAVNGLSLFLIKVSPC
jgi:hypothetical protein